MKCNTVSLNICMNTVFFKKPGARASKTLSPLCGRGCDHDDAYDLSDGGHVNAERTKKLRENATGLQVA